MNKLYFQMNSEGALQKISEISTIFLSQDIEQSLSVLMEVQETRRTELRTFQNQLTLIDLLNFLSNNNAVKIIKVMALEILINNLQRKIQ